ncbi:unnamed protein product [Oppiella nova]|uniref:PDZ domain-containing protein n=1 Tax=Oppiella nova TaxID=334625 RepID=A0A7R9QL71_9ACAR|nr:unnamed protein product [Oppiella nova]CAG2168180.1 unnamed protein product [Oppiella nova]
MAHKVCSASPHGVLITKKQILVNRALVALVGTAKMVDLGGYVIVLVEQNGKIKLYDVRVGAKRLIEKTFLLFLFPSIGSPAERSDCDEILEINGKSLEDSTHQQIIHHIHQALSLYKRYNR